MENTKEVSEKKQCDIHVVKCSNRKKDPNFKHDIFKKKIDLHIKCGFDLRMNGINVGGGNYPIFGRYCGGAYNTCGRSEQNIFTSKDLEKAINFCSKLLMKEIESVSKIPNYFTCRDYLHNKFGKTKVEKLAIDRVFKIIKENYNAIIRST